MVVNLNLYAADNIRLHLPFRVSEGIYRFKPIIKDDLKLTINGQPYPITDLVEQEKSISVTPELGRSFIFSFNTLDYNKKLADGVSYLVTEIMNPSDMLFLLTPQAVYRLPLSRNKLKTVSNIEKLVKKDCETYNKKYLASIQSLESLTSFIKKVLNDSHLILGISIHAANFVKDFPPQFMNYARTFLLPDIAKYREVLNFLGNREGERWCIHFQDRDVFYPMTNSHKVIQEIKNIFSQPLASNAIILNGIEMLENNLTQVETIAGKPLLDVILNGDINFNSIFYGGKGEKNQDDERSPSHYFVENIYSQTSTGSGGEAVFTTDILKSVRNIIDHKDHFYELIYDFDGKIEEKQVQILLKDSDSKPAFKEKFSKEEIESMVYYLSTDKVSIDNFKPDRHQVLFSIKSFKLQEDENDPFGILRVRIQLHDEWGERLYSSERILRTSDKKTKNEDDEDNILETKNDNKIEIKSRNANNVTVLHTLPTDYKGKYVIIISVTDFIRNCSTVITRNITL